MQYQNIETDTTTLAISSFLKNSTEELHLMCTHKGNLAFKQQLKDVIESIANFIQKNNISKSAPVLFRLFLSDCANQEKDVIEISSYLNIIHNGCAISIVQQPPLNGSKVAVWAYILNTNKPITKISENNYFQINNGAYKHIYHTQLVADNAEENSLKQTNAIFKSFNSDLINKNLTIKENCIRTWIYVKDIDYNYHGVVVGRKNLFNTLGMNSNTHFITSTGIEGRHFNYNHAVLMDAYTVAGIIPEQVKFLTAPAHLNPTHEYGVTFERGTSVDYGDRRHIFLSGTASINNKGEVVYPEQIKKQIERVLINIEALLKDAEASITDVAQLVIYLRDVADAKVVNTYFKNNNKDLPKVIVLAPVCRPGWLIEIECIAIKAINNPDYKKF